MAPHHDDEVLGCGGTIAKAVANGDEAKVVVMTNGELGPNYEGDSLSPTLKREQECINACKALGIDDITFLREPDRSVVYRRDLVDRLVTEISDFNPGIVYCPHEQESDREHRSVFEIVREATMLAASAYSPLRGGSYTRRMLLQYEVWTPMSEYQFAVDITQSIAAKLNALRCYKSQLVNRRLDLAVEGLNKYRGVQSGKGVYVEVFRCSNK